MMSSKKLIMMIKALIRVLFLLSKGGKVMKKCKNFLRCVKKINFTIEHEEKIKELAFINGIDYEELRNTICNFVVYISDTWNELKKLFGKVCRVIIDRLSHQDKVEWNIPWKLFLKNQVLTRRPRIVRARSSC